MWEKVGGVAILAGAGLAFYYFSRYQKRAEHPAKGKDDKTLFDLTDKANKKNVEKVVGMEKVVERVLHVLARKNKNNPLLIGEPGVGKTAVVEALAQRIVAKEVPAAFQDKRILVLNLADLLAGTHYRGELEGRLRRIIDQLEGDSRRNILFIDEIHMLEQARGSQGALDIADVLKPALSRGDLHIIGATTWKEYQEYIKPDTALERRFQPVLVEEPDRATAIKILEGVKDEYEQFHGVCIPDETIEAAVNASIKSIKDRFLPDKAFDLIDEACAKVALEAADPSHAVSLGILHAASDYAKNNCPTGQPTVTPEDVESIAQQWKNHRSEPQKKVVG